MMGTAWAAGAAFTGAPGQRLVYYGPTWCLSGTVPTKRNAYSKKPPRCCQRHKP